MKATITKSFFVEEPIDKVWEYLCDPHKIVTCLPGASLTEQMDDRNYKGEVTMKFGPIKAKYAGVITFEEIDVENRVMKLKGKGLDSRGKGSADMDMTGNIAEKENGTQVDYSIIVTVTGMLAQFGARLITDVTNSVFDQFGANFRDKLKGLEVDNTMTAGKMIKGLMNKKKEE